MSSSVDLATPVLASGSPERSGASRGIDWFGDGSVVVVDLGLACCAIESEFAVPHGARWVDEWTDDALVVCVLSGTLTDVLAPLVAARVAALPGARVVSFGACACAGGPYWDSVPVTKGVDQVVHVDLYVPGCPPPPSALAQAVEALRSQHRQEATA